MWKRLFWTMTAAAFLGPFVASCGGGGGGQEPGPLTITNVSPVDGATDVSLSVVLTASFSRELDPATMNATTFTLENGGPVAAQCGYDPATRTAALTPLAPLQPGTTYTARLTTTIAAADGVHLASDFVWSFTTAGPPQVVVVSPTDGTGDAPWTRGVTATFSADIDPTTLTTSTFTLSDGGTVEGSVSYDVASRAATFAPLSPLKPSTSYTARLTTAVAGTSAAHLAADYEWHFTTAPIPSNLRPLDTFANEIRYAGTTERVVLRGVNCIELASMALYYPDHWNAGYFQAMADWGVKTVRLPIFNSAWKWYGERYGQGAYLRLIDWAVAWAAERGMYSIIDLHAIGYPPDGDWQVDFNDPNWGQIYRFTSQDVIDFWRVIAEHFAGDTRIAFYDLFNEPVYQPNSGGHWNPPDAWPRWRAFAETLIDEIRARDPDRVVLVGGLDWAYNLQPAVADPVQRWKVVYSTHPYPGTMNTFPGGPPDWDGAFGEISQYQPVLAGELGFDPNAPPGQDNLRGTVQSYGIPLIDNYLEPRNISWAAFCFGPAWIPALCLDWNYAPTESGEFFRSRLLQH